MIRAVIFLSILVVLAFITPVEAKYLVNEDLKEQIENDKDRTIPATDKLTAAIDGEVFQSTSRLGEEDFYHGTGYWLNARMEYIFAPEAQVNLKSIFYSGTSSNGYGNTSSSGLINFFGLTYRPKLSVGEVYIRLIDLGRQTFGRGLIVDRKETTGAMIQVMRNKTKYELVLDGTGGITAHGDLFYASTTINNDILGFAFYIVNSPGAPEYLPPTATLTSTYRFSDHLKYDAEVGANKYGLAGLLITEYLKKNGSFQYKIRPQVRYYDYKFLNGVESNRGYIDYDQYDIPDMNAHSIFFEMAKRSVIVYGSEFNFDYVFTDSFRMYFDNEVNIRRYYDETKTIYYFKLAGVFYPITDRDDTITLFVTNKLLNTYYEDGGLTAKPGYYHFANDMFKKQYFGGVSVNFKF